MRVTKISNILPLLYSHIIYIYIHHQFFHQRTTTPAVLFLHAISIYVCNTPRFFFLIFLFYSLLITHFIITTGILLDGVVGLHIITVLVLDYED